MYKATIDKVFKAAEKQREAAEALKSEKSRVAKSLVETSPDEFIEMRIRDSVFKKLGKQAKARVKVAKLLSWHTLTEQTSLMTRDVSN